MGLSPGSGALAQLRDAFSERLHRFEACLVARGGTEYPAQVAGRAVGHRWHVRSHAVAANAGSSTYAAIATRFFSTMRLLKSAIAMTVRLKALMKATMMRSATYCPGR